MPRFLGGKGAGDWFLGGQQELHGRDHLSHREKRERSERKGVLCIPKKIGKEISGPPSFIERDFLCADVGVSS